MTDLMQYDELVQRHDAAYTAFKQIYTSKNPPPVLQQTGADWLSVLALGVLVVASITVSGSRTIGEFGGGVIGVAAFVMLEIALIAYAYWRTRKAGDADANQHLAVRRRANFGMWLAFGVSLSANLHATLKHGGAELPPMLDTVILVMIAVSAPSLALIAGDMLGMEAVAGLALKARAEEDYRDAYQLWLDALNKSWDSNKSRWGVRIEALRDEPASVLPPAPVLSQLPSHETGRAETERHTGYGFQRTADGETQVLSYFRDHPDDVLLPVRELEAKIGVSKSTVSRARRKWLAETGDSQS